MQIEKVQLETIVTRPNMLFSTTVRAGRRRPAVALVLISLIFVNVSRAQSVTGTLSTLDKARVFVYRYKQFVGSALEPSVYCDENQLARMDNGRFFIVELPPGV